MPPFIAYLGIAGSPRTPGNIDSTVQTCLGLHYGWRTNLEVALGVLLIGIVDRE